MNVDNDRVLDEHMEESGVTVADSAVSVQWWVVWRQTPSSPTMAMQQVSSVDTSVLHPHPHPSSNIFEVGIKDHLITFIQSYFRFPEHFKLGDMDQYS